MFLRSNKRIKDGKEHRHYSVVENRRLGSGKVARKQMLYLGEINSSQQSAWRKSLDVFDERQRQLTSLSLFAEDRPVPADAVDSVQVKLSEMKLGRDRTATASWDASCANNCNSTGSGRRSYPKAVKPYAGSKSSNCSSEPPLRHNDLGGCRGSVLGNKFEAQLGGVSLQVAHPDLQAALLRGLGAAVHILLAEFQRAEYQGRQLARGSENRDAPIPGASHMAEIGAQLSRRLLHRDGVRRMLPTRVLPAREFLFLPIGLPPVTFMFGARPRCETKAPSLGNSSNAGPYSLITTSIVSTPTPSIAVPSTPVMPNSARRAGSEACHKTVMHT